MIGTGTLISPYLIIAVILCATLLITVYMLIYQFIIPSIDNRKFKAFLLKWTFRSQLLLWCVYIVYFFYRFLMTSPLFTITSIALVVLLGWHFWKDLISGLIFKIEEKVQVGDIIQFEDHSGKISKIGNRNIVLDSESNEQQVIYHRQLVQKGFRILREKGRDNALEIIIDKKLMEDFGGMRELGILVKSCPWVSPAHEAEIRPIKGDKISIKTWALHPEDRTKYRDFILKELEDKIKH